MFSASRLIVAAAIALLLAGLWPFIAVVNRIQPMILGLPFLLFWLSLLNVLVAALLAVAYRKLR
jgi:hypothetical protein